MGAGERRDGSKLSPPSSLQVPLSGNLLIEASAGTGKTYTITTLYLRLLVQRRLGVDQILVVTFTEKATAELRDRIRTRLREAVRLCARDEICAHAGEAPSDEASDTPAGGVSSSSEDAELSAMFQAALERGDDPPSLRERLTAELRRFDEAAIFTIHGFCQRMLGEHAFECGVPFDAELVGDDASLCDEVALDFWAREVYDAPERLVAFFRAFGADTDGLTKLARAAVSDPDLQVIPRRPSGSWEEHELRYLEAHAAAARIWRRAREEVTELLHTSRALNRQRYAVRHIPNRLAALDAYLQADPPPTEPPDVLAKYFVPERLAAGTKKNHPTPSHPLFEAFGALLEAQEALLDGLAARLLELRLDLVEYVRREVPRRRETTATLSFDDLLRLLDRALDGDGGEALCRLIRGRFRAALIDEFQDTDPLQDSIFRKIFTDRESLFLIGDPKQAIYGFRGADIYTYLAAAERVRGSQDDSRHFLGVNYRSDPAAITAVNTIFGRARAPFVDPRISFEPVLPREGRGDSLTGGDHHRSGLELLFVSRELAGLDARKQIPKAWAGSHLPDLLAGEMAHLLSSGLSLGDRPLAPGDLAVLVMRNAEAAPIQEALRRRSIPAVVHGEGSVLFTPEAQDLQRLLFALAEPTHDGLVRAALATSLLGADGLEIQRISADEDAWQRLTEEMLAWTRLWRDRGFMLAFRTMMEARRVPQRLLGLPDGERRMTNLLHLSELLHRASEAERLGPAGLASWLSRARAEAEPGMGLGVDELQMRMESDARAVQILTTHKSKGLEFPVVYCPFLWEVFSGSGVGVRFHDPGDGYKLKLDLGSEEEDEHRELADLESLAERLRLAYVALTRARHLSVVVWGAFKDAESSALAYLLHQAHTAGAGACTGAELAAAVAARVGGAGDGDLLADLDALPDAAAGSISLRELGELSASGYSPDVLEDVPMMARVLHNPPDRSWRSTSFTGLTSQRPVPSPQGLEGRDVDEIDGPLEPDGESDSPLPLRAQEESLPSTGPEPPRGASPEPVLLHDFPRGARAGNMLHAIFERLDLSRPEEVRGLVEELCPRFGFESAWWPLLEEAILQILATPLDPDGETRLQDVSPGRSRPEMEFVLPLAQGGAHGLDVEQMARVFSSHEPTSLAGYGQEVAALGFARVRGYLRGFIDLVFESGGRYYLVDYKSNHLGSRPEDYAPRRLADAMIAHHYPLQYHLYTVAFHRHLSQRLPGYDYERHFGGVRYLFLRGMSPDRPGNGVFVDRPSIAMVRDLSALLEGVESLEGAGAFGGEEGGR